MCNKCPVCQQPQGIITGNQPRGQMTFRIDRYSVPGYEGKIPYREKPTLRYYYISVCLVLKNNNNSKKSRLKLLKLALVARYVLVRGVASFRLVVGLADFHYHESRPFSMY